MANIKTLTINGVKYTVVDEQAQTKIGDLSALATEDKSSLVAAINEAAAPLTNQEKAEIVAQVIAAMPDGDEVEY